uniref:Fimbrial protein n=1 Tax=Pectobacterium carotovorum TaxID=554 RepID=A0A0N9MZL3_PECCA|nr:DUF5462 family protein [Pectobacterium carotovorum]ALG88442.1 Hypothetical protein [Pectobacterium carotovorum]
MTHTATPFSRQVYRQAIAMAIALGLSSSVLAQERQHVEALGVVNGSMSARSTWVDITVFLSGQPLFSATTQPDAPALTTLVVERATLVSKDGQTLRVQQPFALPKGGEGQLQVQVQVQVNGKAVTVSVQETALGVQLTLPSDAQSVTVVPVGAAQMTVPNTTRGDLSVALRITGDSDIAAQ